jgi:ribosome biogenesis protein BMS1
MIDSSVGFEMETFEFLSLLKNHGFTSVMGVLTHMDEFRVNKSLNKLKKQIKKRFLKEVTDKAKLFYLYGIKNNLYMKVQMHNLARYLKVIKPTVPGFRQNHPYVLADRFDVTFLNSTSNDPEDEVMVSLFGYVRGNNLNKNSTMHIMGLGDYQVDYAMLNDDPCPVETVEVKGRKKRTLKQKEKFLYAPYCNINSLEYDRNAGYITIPERFVTFTKGIGESKEVVLDEGVRIVRELQDMKKSKGIDQQIDEEELEIFEGVNVDYKESENKKRITGSGRSINNNIDQDEISSRYDNDSNYRNTNSKVDEIVNNFDIRSKPMYYKETGSTDIMKNIYENNSTNDEDEDNDVEDCYKYQPEDTTTFIAQNFDLNFYIKFAKKRFITGSSITGAEGGEMFNDIEDGEESDDGSDKKSKKSKKDKELKDADKEEEVGETVFANKSEEEQQKILADVNRQLKPFMSSEYGIFEKGSYVRLDIKKIKRKFVDHFRIDYPIVLCTTNIQENSMGFLKIKFSKHIWHPKIMKTNDPLILSIGWRKFQTCPVYCVEDKNKRLRMIKYTPKFTSCYAICYGPFLPINVSVVGIQNFNSNEQDPTQNHFRICGTGDLLEVNQNFEILKKLKLIGEPMEIFKKTAFVKGMFNSNMEVARYIGAKIQTVSGIRGQIKKQLNVQPEGSFRATFEDKIVKSDIVFLKTWNPVLPNKFYNPIVNYGKMKLLRTMAQLRRDFDLALPQKNDSEYKDVKREERVFPSLMIPKSLENALPFKAKNKIKSQVKGKSINYEEDDTFLLKKLNLPYKKKIKSFMTEKEKSVYSLLQRLQTIKNIKDRKTKQVAKEFDEKKKEADEKTQKLMKKRNREKMIKNIKNKKK